MLRHFDRLSDRSAYGSIAESPMTKGLVTKVRNPSDRKRLVAEPSVAELVEASKRTNLISLYKNTYFLTENAQMMASLKVSPGRSTVVG